MHLKLSTTATWGPAPTPSRTCWDPTSFLTDDALAELVGEALAPGAGAAIVTPEASPGVTPCGCRIQPTQFFQ